MAIQININKKYSTQANLTRFKTKKYILKINNMRLLFGKDSYSLKIKMMGIFEDKNVFIRLCSIFLTAEK